MAQLPFDFIDFPQSELVVGLVAPTGTDTKKICDTISERLDRYGYTTVPIKLSNFLKKIELGVTIDESTKFKRTRTLMDAGDALREKVGRGDALALMAVSEIFRERPDDEDSKEIKKPKKSKPKTAYVLDSLKHPDEVIALRRIYGDGFVLFSIFSSQETRLKNLEEFKGMTSEEAQILIDVDQEENRPSGLGQRTRDTFHLADAFIDANDFETGRSQLLRILDILFGNLYKTPTFNEYAMFLAFASAFRSGDLSRQVGAVIASEGKEIIAVGCNDVPRFGGGLYSSDDDDDYRDHVIGVDSNIEKKNEIYKDIVKMVQDKFLNGCEDKDEDALLSDVKTYLSGTTLANITEFGRTVHAEMDAIVSCARKGISVRGGTLYTTTFPCHNCARHIVAAGIKTVVYVEPYPKSQAGKLHDDSIDLEKISENKVSFQPFVGIGSRRFMDLFSMGMSSGYPIDRKVSGTGKAIEWNPEMGKLRVPMLPTSYIERERLAVDKLNKLLEDTDETQKEAG